MFNPTTAINSRVPGRNSHRCAALSLIETILSAIGIVGVLSVLVLVSGSLRADTTEARTRDTLGLLHQALGVYLREHDKPLLATDAAEALGILTDDPATTALMGRVAVMLDEHGVLSVLDGYGRAMIYQKPDLADHQTGAFVSAGRDGKFGDAFSLDPTQRRANTDNHYSFELEVPQ